MRTISLLLLSGVLTAALAEPLQLMSGFASTDDYSVRYETRLEPGGDKSEIKNIGGGLQINDGRFHRYLLDRSRKVYFGYDLLVEVTEDGRYRTRFLPLSIRPRQIADPEFWTLIPLPGYPGEQLLASGDTVLLDLMVHPASGRKIVDFLTIGGDIRRSETAHGPARDFAVGLAPLHLNKPRITIGGETPAGAEKFGGAVSGPIVWIYLENRGRFLLSLIPRPEYGFLRAGELRGSSLHFDWGGERIEINCAGRIAPARGAFHLYVRRDAEFRPAGPGFRMGATDSPRALPR